MPSKTIKIISWSDRSWMSRQYQQFCGRFELDETSGLYFDVETPAAHRKLIVRTFLKFPKQVRDAAAFLELTVSTTTSPGTVSGNQSAVYGAWDRPHSQISPHLQMTETSLASELVFPHLLHECCHLFWAIQSKAAKMAFKDEMEELLNDAFVEVTAYAESYLNEWRQALILPAGMGIQQRRNRARDQWVMESFCESVAKICCPAYKEHEDRHTQQLLERRQAAMVRHFQLMLMNR